MMAMRDAHGLRMLFVGAVVGTLSGLLTGLTAGYLKKAEATYADAVRLLEQGDRKGARQAIRQYVKLAGEDPERELRLPVAERFLQDEGASLDVPAELEAAPAPGGRGTEPEAAPAPAGRGTEPLAAAEPAGQGTEPLAAAEPDVPEPARQPEREPQRMG
jgi:hypothetical protein